VAVLGCGPDVAYPASNHGLLAEIAARGAVVSEYPPGTQPDAGNFPARNRIVSGLAVATLVVEAGVKSGALITARCAVEQGRDVFAVPGSIFRASHAGANALLGAGAGVALSADDILAALDLTQLVPVAPPRAVVTSPAESALLARLGVEPVHVDALGRQAGLGASEVATTLSLLEIKGLARHLGGMLWVAEP
jgi:DNA processing protein